MTKDSWNPLQYEKFKSERSQPFFDLIDLIHPGSFQRAVDLGCGTGELTNVFHHRFSSAETVGIDNSESMLTSARNLESNGLTFLNADLSTWCEPDQIDVIV